MTSVWAQIEAEEKAIYELESAKNEALGRLLGSVDAMAWPAQHPGFSHLLDDVLERLLAARDAYDAAEKAYRTARQAAFDARKLKASE